MNIAEICLQKKVVTVCLSIALFLAGVASYFKLGRLEDPEFTIKQAQIITMYPGATAKEVADEVTDRIEIAIQELGQLKRVTSTSYPGRSIIVAEMEDKYDKNDLPQIWDELRRKVNDIAPTLPKGCRKPIVYDDFGDVYGVLYAIYGDGYTYAELKEHAKMLRRELLLCDDVAKIDLLGDQQEIVSFELSRAKMAVLGITPEMISKVISGQNIVSDAGRITIGDKYVRIHPHGSIDTIEEFGDILLTLPGKDADATIHLRDLMTITRDYQDPPSCIVRYNGKPSVALGISTAKGGNVITMGDSIDKRMRELLSETPIGIEVGIISHQAKSVDAAVSGFVVNLVESVLIVIAVLLFTMGMRSGLIIGGVLILTVMGTIVLMDWMGILFERISLGAFIIALGMLVDNAIVITEAVLIAAQKGEDKKAAAIAVVKQTQWPLLGATAVAILSFAPIGASQDSSGEYCRSLFLVLLISLLMSWVLAITVTPLLASRFLKSSPKKEKEEPKDPYAGKMFQMYRSFLVSCIRNKGFTWFVLLLMLAAAIAGFSHIQQNFFPDSTRPQFMVHLWTAEGSAIETTHAELQKVEKEVAKMEGVQNVTSITGSGGLRFLLTYTPEDPDSAYGILFVDVESDKQISGLMEKINEKAKELVPNSLVYCQRFVLGPGDPQKIQLRIQGKDPQRLREYADQVIDVMNDDPRLVEIQSDWRNRVDLLKPQIIENRARKLGLTRQDIAQAYHRATDGANVGFFDIQDESLPIILRAPKCERNDPDSLNSAWVWSNQIKASIPLAQVVSGLQSSSEEARLKRRDRTLCITVKCNTTGETAASAFKRIAPKLENLLSDMPEGYFFEWGGEHESSQLANEGLAGKIPPIIGIMVLIVIMLFNSSRHALVIFMTVPLIIIGVTVGLLTFNQPFGFMALLGFLSLVGMQIKNAIVLMDEIKAQKDAGVDDFNAVVNSGVTRLRPVAMAALTTVLGMMPLIVDAFYSAMAVTIMFGLTFATILTMVVIPVNYALIYRVKELPPAEA